MAIHPISRDIYIDKGTDYSSVIELSVPYADYNFSGSIKSSYTSPNSIPIVFASVLNEPNKATISVTSENTLLLRRLRGVYDIFATNKTSSDVHKEREGTAHYTESASNDPIPLPPPRGYKITATDVTYVNATSGLTSNDAQAAIDELTASAVSEFVGLTDSVTVNLPVVNMSLANALATKATLVSPSFSGPVSISSDGLDEQGAIITSDVDVGATISSRTSSGARILTSVGDYHAAFGNSGINQSFVARLKGSFGWFRGAFTGRIHSPDVLTANRAWTLPDATGTLALTTDISDVESTTSILAKLDGEANVTNKIGEEYLPPDWYAETVTAPAPAEFETSVAPTSAWWDHVVECAYDIFLPFDANEYEGKKFILRTTSQIGLVGAYSNGTILSVIPAPPNYGITHTLVESIGGIWMATLNYSGKPVTAEQVPYLNVFSGLAATDVQAAIDELADGGGMAYTPSETPPTNHKLPWYDHERGVLAVWHEQDSVYVGVSGEVGPMGPTGAIGPMGPTGATGNTGPAVTVDATIIDGSANAVAGNAVFDALAGKQPIDSDLTAYADALDITARRVLIGAASIGDITAANFTGTLPVSKGGTGATAASVGTGGVLLGNQAVSTGSGVTFATVNGGTLSGNNSGDNAVNSLYSGLVTNQTHTGDATGSGALTVRGINGVLVSGLATGILKNTAGTGAPSIAVASDFPTLNQSTTGNAATVTTNANLTGHITSIGNAASLGSFTLAQLSTAVSDANIARSDAAQTFAGGQTFAGVVTADGGIVAMINDVATFGTASFKAYGTGGISTTSGNIFTGNGNISSGGNLTVAGNTTVAAATETAVALGMVTTAATIAIATGTLITATLTASTACVFTMPAAGAGKSFTLLLKQAATTGNGSATFTGVKWSSGTAPAITATAAKMDILTFVSDGASWYGSIAQNFTP